MMINTVRIKANSSFICIIFDHLHATFVANSILMYTESTLTSIWLKLKFATDRQPWWRSLQDESSPMWFGIAWRYSHQHLHHNLHRNLRFTSRRDFAPPALEISLGQSLGPRGAKSQPLGNLSVLGGFISQNISSRQCTDTILPSSWQCTHTMRILIQNHHQIKDRMIILTRWGPPCLSRTSWTRWLKDLLILVKTTRPPRSDHHNYETN